MVWSCGLQYVRIVGQECHSSVLISLKGWNTHQITVFFRDREACLGIEKQLTPLADIMDDYGCLYPSQTLFRAYVISNLPEYSRGLRDLWLIKIRWQANEM